MPDEDRPPGIASPATRAVTVVAAVVLLVVIAGLLWIGAREPGGPPGDPGASPSIPVPPAEPTSEALPPTPSDEPPPVPDPSVPASLCPSPIVSPPITALTFNIHGGLGGGGLNLDRIAEEITTWDADVVLLQEVDEGRPRTGGQRQADELGRLTGMHAVYGGNGRMRGGGTIGNAILSRHPILSSANTALPLSTGREPRGALGAVIDVDGLEISVYSTHWDHHSPEARREQAAALGALVAAEERPILVGGDLNTVPDAPAVRILRRAGLKDVWKVGEGLGLTVPAHSPRRRIDYVLFGNGFRPMQAAVLTSAISDHRAVWSRLQVRRRLPCLPVGEPAG